MNDLGTKENPVRCSSLPMLLTCAGFVKLRMIYSDESGVAATLGTAAGRAIELWHQNGDVTEALRIAKGEAESGKANGQAGLGEREVAELTTVVNSYVEDERNHGDAVVVESLEQECLFEYKGVWFKGHFDCIRRGPDGLEMWDLKFTKRYSGTQAVAAYAAQLAAYTYAAREIYGEPVKAGGIIRLTGYVSPKRVLKDPPSERPVFFPCNWQDGVVEYLLDQCVDRIMALDEGKTPINPGTHCGFCVATSPDNCMRLLK